MQANANEKKPSRQGAFVINEAETQPYEPAKLPSKCLSNKQWPKRNIK
jgi:hypothetical protein